jgi:NADH-quinone oxidoreductase subunit K
MSPVDFFVLSALLFGVGIFGFVVRRNIMSVFFSLELLFNSANVLLVGFSKLHENFYGEVFVFFVLAVAAVETAVGLAIAVALYRLTGSIDVSDFKTLRW